MKKTLLQFLLAVIMSAGLSSAYALSDDFYATGEDLEYMFEADSNYAIEELEYKLRKFVLYRKLEEFLFDLDNEYPGTNN